MTVEILMLIVQACHASASSDYPYNHKLEVACRDRLISCFEAMKASSKMSDNETITYCLRHEGDFK